MSRTPDPPARAWYKGAEIGRTPDAPFGGLAVSVAPPARRSYTPADRAAAMACLAANAGNVKRTAKECGVAHRTVRDWAAAAVVDPALPIPAPAPLTRPYFAPDVAEPFFGPSPAPAMAAEARRVAADALACIRRKLAGPLDNLSLKDLVAVYGVCVDKAVLLEAAAPAGSAAEPPREVLDLDRLSLDQLLAWREMIEVATVDAGPRGETIDLDLCTDEELDMLERLAYRARADRLARRPTADRIEAAVDAPTGLE